MIGRLVNWVRAQNETTQGLVVAGTLGLSVVIIVVLVIGILTRARPLHLGRRPVRWSGPQSGAA
jgi:hypothetical protein